MMRRMMVPQVHGGGGGDGYVDGDSNGGDGDEGSDDNDYAT